MDDSAANERPSNTERVCPRFNEGELRSDVPLVHAWDWRDGFFVLRDLRRWHGRQDHPRCSLSYGRVSEAGIRREDEGYLRKHCERGDVR